MKSLIQSKRTGWIAIGCLTLLTLLLMATAASMLRPGYYINSGNLHDIFLPYNSALAGLQGLQLHRDFHTPFGWVYAALNQVSWLIATQPSGVFSINDLMVVASMVWAAGILTLYALMLSILPKDARPTLAVGWLIGLFLVLVAFNFRGLAGFSLRNVTWYGTYNNHLWALLFLQMLGAFFLARVQPRLPVVVASVLIQSVAVALAMNYKVSFGIGSFVLAGLPLLSPWAGRGWRLAYGVGGILGAVTLSILAAPPGYEWSLYLSDLRVAVAAKSEHGSPISWDLVALSAIMVSAVSFVQGVFQSQLSLNNGARALQQGWLPLFLGLGLTVALNLAIVGDFARPYFYVLAGFSLFALVTIRAESHGSVAIMLIRGGACAVLIAGVMANLGSDIRIARYKTESALSRGYERVTLTTPWGPLNWAIQRHAVYEQLTDLFDLGTHPRQQEIMASMAFPTGGKRPPMPVPYLNGDYVDALVSAQHALQQHLDRVPVSLLMLEFANPLPLLTGMPIPKGSFHWIHFGTSLPSFRNDEDIFAMFNAADTVVLPVVAIDGRSQMLLNCKFHQWNVSKGRPFVPYQMDRFHFYYSRKPAASILPALDSPDVSARCASLLDDFRTGRIKPM